MHPIHHMHCFNFMLLCGNIITLWISEKGFHIYKSKWFIFVKYILFIDRLKTKDVWKKKEDKTRVDSWDAHAVS